MAVVWALACPLPAAADGLFDGFSGDTQGQYVFVSTKRTDGEGDTTKLDVSSYFTRTNLRLNYNLFPKINLNAGTTFEGSLLDPSPGEDTTTTRLRPYVWLRLQDPLLTAAVGYDLRDDTTKTSGEPKFTLTREAYNANLLWRPADLPITQVRYTHTWTRDGDRDFQDVKDDLVFLKSEYLYRGLDVYYAGSYQDRDDRIRDRQSNQTTHEGRLLYGTTFLDDRVSINTDNHVRYAEFESTTEQPVPPLAGLSVLDDTPTDGALALTPALIDGNRTASAGINIGYPGPGGDFRARNIGLDFQASVSVNRLDVWVEGWGPADLPADISNWYTWDVYTSTDNLTWTFHAKVQPAVFGPFDRRFQVSFPTVNTRYIKVVTRPLPGGIIGTTDSSAYPSILVTELEAAVDLGSQQVTRKSHQTTQNYKLDVRVLLLRSPSLYYTFSGLYYEFDPGSQRRYSMSNGLTLQHPLTPMLTVSASTSVEVGHQDGETRTGVFYYGSLVATPLPTLTDSLVVNGSQNWEPESTSTSNSITLYNTARLYRGIDATLSLGVAFRSDDPDQGSSSHQRDLFTNAGFSVTPNRWVNLSAYYTGRLRHLSGGNTTGPTDTTEHTLDAAASVNPFPSLSLSAGVNVKAQTGEDTDVYQNYGLSWSPFPQGNLQFTFYYTEAYSPDRSRNLSPSVRLYLTARRRSYLEASYQYSASDPGDESTRSHLVRAGLKVYF